MLWGESSVVGRGAGGRGAESGSTTVIVRLPARVEPPRMPGGELPLEAPPEVPRVIPGNTFIKLMPVVMIVAMVGIVAMMISSGMATNPMMLLFPAMMLFSVVAMIGSGGGRGHGQRTAETDENRKDYLRYLGRMRREVARTERLQRDALEWTHPDPNSLWTLVGTDRMWERRRGDADFCHVRIGQGSQRLATRLVPPEIGPVEDLEPVAAVSLRRFVRGHSIARDLPIAVALRGFPVVSVSGERARARALVASIIMQLCTFHGPDVLRVVVVRSFDVAADWEWVKWLPHATDPNRTDGAGQARLIFDSFAAATAGLSDLLAGRGRFVRSGGHAEHPQIVIVADGSHIGSEPVGRAADGIDSVTFLDLAGAFETSAAEAGLRLRATEEGIGAIGAAGVEWFGSVDRVEAGGPLVWACGIAPFRLPSAGAAAEEAELGDPGAWHRLIGLPDPATFDTERMWAPRPARERLRVAIGIGPDARPVEIDLKESAEGGMGPHGLCVGATGSGKSEFLRTLVLGLIATHPPDVLNLVLVDFKGGATFLGLEPVAHVAAVITNLADESALVERMRDALSGEMNRRQEVLRAAGNFANVSDYQRARAAGADLPALPALFIVVDEFSELLSQHPDFAELFVAIGRLGRSLHIHLLLASQRLDEGRMRGLESHLSYRIGLKTFSANESRSVLGVPDAYHLPAQPGAAYLKTDADELVRFTAAFVSGPYRTAAYAPRSPAGSPVTVEQVSVFRDTFVPIDPSARVDTRRRRGPDRPDSAEGPPTETTGTVLQTVVSRIVGRGRPAHRVWLPVLVDPPSLDMLLPVRSADAPPLRAAIGVIDRPFDQRRDQLTVDLSGARGHVVVVGGPQSGKSTAVRTLVLALAATQSAQQVQFYCLDFGGGSLGGLAGLPHVGSVAGRTDADRVRRTVAELVAIVHRREREFRRRGIESASDYRARRTAGVIDGDPFGDVFLVIDGWATIRTDYEPLEEDIRSIAASGLSYGVHVVVAATRWAEIRPAMKDLLGTRVELRLGDPADSEYGRAKASRVPAERPGRGMTPDGSHLLIAAPRLDGVPGMAGIAAAMAAAVERISRAHRGHIAPRVRMLPDLFDRDDWVASLAPDWPSAEQRRRIPIGIDESELAPVVLDFGETPHMVAYGDARSGKTGLLRTVARGLMQAHSSDQVRLLVVDYRRTLLGEVPPGYLAGYASTAPALASLIGEVATLMRRRLPGPETTPAQLRDRSWWTGPEVYILIDDYDLVVSPSGNPLAPLVEVLPQARDVGVHVVLARRSGGAGRALFEPVLSRIRDLEPLTLILSGSRDEGALIGSVRPGPQPAGRGTLVSREGSRLVQLAWSPPTS